MLHNSKLELLTVMQGRKILFPWRNDLGYVFDAVGKDVLCFVSAPSKPTVEAALDDALMNRPSEFYALTGKKQFHCDCFAICGLVILHSVVVHGSEQNVRDRRCRLWILLALMALFLAPQATLGFFIGVCLREMDRLFARRLVQFAQGTITWVTLDWFGTDDGKPTKLQQYRTHRDHSKRRHWHAQRDWIIRESRRRPISQISSETGVHPVQVRRWASRQSQ